MNDAMIQSMTGMSSGKAKRPVRRGGGRHKAPAPAAAHHDAVNAAMAKGDHAAAKSSALMLAKALHAALLKNKPPGGDPNPASADPFAPAE